MAVSFDKDRKRWRYDFIVAGERRRGYCVTEDGTDARTRTEAKAAQTIARAAVLQRPGQPAPQRGTYTFAQACAARVAAARHLRNWPNIADYIAELRRFFGDATAVDAIEARVPAYVDWSRRQVVRTYAGGPRKPDAATVLRPRGAALWRATGRTRRPGTINRYLTELRTILNAAHATKDAAGRPLLPVAPAFANLEEPKDPPRPIGETNLRQILDGAPRHLVDLVVLVISTGLRLNEALRLEVDQVDAQYRGLWLDSSTKGKRGAFVPIEDEAVFAMILALVAAARAAGQARLILYRGRWGTEDPRPIDSVTTSWRTRLKKLGLTGKHRFHNTRADFVSYLAARGAPPGMLQKLARHVDFKTTGRYLDVADEAKRAAMRRIADRPALQGLDLIAPEARTKAAPTHPQKSPTQTGDAAAEAAKMLKRQSRPRSSVG